MDKEAKKYLDDHLDIYKAALDDTMEGNNRLMMNVYDEHVSMINRQKMFMKRDELLMKLITGYFVLLGAVGGAILGAYLYQRFGA